MAENSVESGLTNEIRSVVASDIVASGARTAAELRRAAILSLATLIVDYQTITVGLKDGSLWARIVGSEAFGNQQIVF